VDYHEGVVILPQFATKNHAVTLSLLPPSPVGWGRESAGKRQKLVGWDENSLTVLQRETKTTINNSGKKHIQHVVFSPPDAQLAPE